MALSFGGRLLSDLGAEVIKVEPPGGGDPLRHEGPLVGEPGTGEATALFGYLNAGKRSITLDCTRASGDDMLSRIANKCDLVLWAPRDTSSSSLEALLLGADGDSPALLTVTPYGMQGTDARRPGTPFIVQHSSGFAFHQAAPVTDPENTPPVACADREAALTVGLVVGISALWAIEAARGSNSAPLVDLSAEDVFAYMLVEPYAEANGEHARYNRQREPGSGTAVVGGLVWYLPCADGAILVSPREDHQWANWVHVMGSPDWAKDPELCGSRPVRTKNAERLQELMAEWSATQAANDVFVAAQENRVACFPLSSADDLLANPQLEHRRFFSSLDCGNGQTVPIPGLPFHMRDGEGRVLEKGTTVQSPALGEGNQKIIFDGFELDDTWIETLVRYQLV
nr:CoA transferase [Silicimonas algicola]